MSFFPMLLFIGYRITEKHRKAFQNFWEMLKPMNDNNNNHKSINGNSNISGSDNSTGSSQLLIQCGGYGNLQQIIKILKRITHLDQFKEYFRNWKQPWYCAKPDDTYKLLAEIGYVNTSIFVQ
jgi:hypothetical protein